MQVSFSDNLLGRIFSGAGVPLDKGPAAHGEPHRDRRARRQSRQEDHSPEHDPYRSSHDRRLQLAGGLAEAAHLLHLRRALQPGAGAHRSAGRSRHDRLGWHGIEV